MTSIGTNGENIKELFSYLIPEMPELEFGAHLHSLKSNWEEKVHAAYEAGCLRFDSAMRGIGGCPMAKDELVGNLATENLVSYFNGFKALNLDEKNFSKSMDIAGRIFQS